MQQSIVVSPQDTCAHSEQRQPETCG